MHCLACDEGRFGHNCKRICKCRHGSKCDHVTGSCTCKPGYTGKYCEISESFSRSIIFILIKDENVKD